MEPLEGEQTAQLNEHLIFGRCQLVSPSGCLADSQ